MSDEIEAAGAFTTAGLAAAVIDGGGRVRHPDEHRVCANCGTVLTGRYCHACGQQAHVHRSLRHMAHEALHGILHFDGKIWRTLPKLAFRPGKLTREYIEGHRARHVSPLALFLFVTFLMYFVFSMTSDVALPAGIAPDVTVMSTETRAEMVADLEQAAADSRAAVAEAERAGTATAADRVARDTAEMIAARARGESTAPEPDTRVATGAEAASDDFDVQTGVPGIDDRVNKARKNPELFLYKLKNAAYKFSFLLVPLSLPFIWLMFFWRRDVTMYDHTVFSLYSLSFMSLLFIAAMLLARVPDRYGEFAGLLALVVPVHMYAQLKGAYALSHFGATWRLLAMSGITVSTAVVFMLSVIALGFW